ncbi:putative tRNA adenosine deaminase-associated protein [Raineyella antarctica]|uniref:Putative tRNA adenosine deaminase-associated protein n=1 Tax=Raineyella antarctica TaxID=1577474 RepID=A0A1G6GFM3_9ACTN|nr:putative tRNA adenosine deaminase-associated protein [Raineyella antarctica]
MGNQEVGVADYDDEELDDLDLDTEEEVDEDDDDQFDDDFDEDDYEEIEDATDDDVDFAVAAYREDGNTVVVALDLEMANDLDEMINHLRRLPGEAGAMGMLSLVEEVFVIVRVRGAVVQVFLSDGAAAYDWPIARDILDYLGIDEPPEGEDEDDVEPVGDSEILRDLGVGDFDLEQLAEDFDTSSDEALLQLADRIGMGPQVRATVREEFED